MRNDPLRILVHAVAAIRCHPGFKPEISGSALPTSVNTTAEDGSCRLPKTQQPIRGLSGVKVDVSDGSYWSGTTITLRNRSIHIMAFASKWPREAKGGDLVDLERDLHAAFVVIRNQIREWPRLWCRLNDSRGYKHYEPQELMEQLAAEKSDDDDIWIALSDAFAGALTDLGFTWEGRSQFAEWDQVVDHIAAAWSELASRDYHTYEAVAFLNGPWVDDHTPIELGQFDGVVARFTQRSHSCRRASERRRTC